MAKGAPARGPAVNLRNYTPPYRARFRKLAKKAKLRACWSQPVLSAADDALEPQASRPADMVIADLLMPGMGGNGLIRRLRQTDPELPGASRCFPLS